MAMRFTFRSTSNLAHIQQLTVSEIAPILKQQKCVCCFGRRSKLSLCLRMSPSLSLSEIKTKARERERRWWKPFYCFLGQRLKENKRERTTTWPLDGLSQMGFSVFVATKRKLFFSIHSGYGGPYFFRFHFHRHTGCAPIFISIRVRP